MLSAQKPQVEPEIARYWKWESPNPIACIPGGHGISEAPLEKSFWRIQMKRYRIKNQNGKLEFIDILKEIEDGFLIRHTRLYDGDEKITEETITRHLLTICVRTGYLFEMSREAVSA